MASAVLLLTTVLMAILTAAIVVVLAGCVGVYVLAVAPVGFDGFSVREGWGWVLVF